MQIPPGQTAIPQNPVPPAPVSPQPERVQAAEPARRVTASREGTESETKPRSRSDAATTGKPGGGAKPRGGVLDLFV